MELEWNIYLDKVGTLTGFDLTNRKTGEVVFMLHPGMVFTGRALEIMNALIAKRGLNIVRINSHTEKGE